MADQGYLQDLWQINKDYICLLSANDNTQLITDSQIESESKECRVNLTESTLAAMMLLDDTESVLTSKAETNSLPRASPELSAKSYSPDNMKPSWLHKHHTVEEDLSILRPHTPAYPSSRSTSQNIDSNPPSYQRALFSTQTASGYLSDPQIVQGEQAESSSVSETASSLHGIAFPSVPSFNLDISLAGENQPRPLISNWATKTKTSPLTTPPVFSDNVAPGPPMPSQNCAKIAPPPSFHSGNMDLDIHWNKNPSPSAVPLPGSGFAKMTLSDSPVSSPTTALAMRTTKDVIADLKRPLHPFPVESSPLKRHQSSQSSQVSTPFMLNDPQYPPQATLANADAVPKSENSGEEEDEEEDENEIQLSTKSRMVSERKRRLNALADKHIQGRILESMKQDFNISHQKNEDYSTRVLIQQAESQKIITTPREYQTELYERAKEKNIIAVLDTGSGKTLIAVLLLRHTIAQELEDRAMGKPKRVSFFLVHSTALLFQQHAVLKTNLDHPMNMFCGDMGTDLWTKAVWEMHFQQNMVILCTAEVLRLCLHHSFISMDQINLLIFDEAHHAKNDHPYARIIKDFYAQKRKATTILPKIFGMTASPVDARVDVKKAAAELETILHCEIATAFDTSLEAFTGTSKQEKLAAYDTLGPEFETPLYQKMKERLNTNHVFKRPLNRAKEATRELGSWCADQVWSFCLREDEVKKLHAKTERQYHAKKVPGPLKDLEQHRIQLENARKTVQNHTFDDPEYKEPPGNSAPIISKNLSSKVVVLISYLRDRFQRPTDDKCIVFVTKRYTARLLAQLLSHPNIRPQHLLVGTLIGTRPGDAGDLNTSFREQVITMMNFRKGVVNCLFATSVAEEGLDIPDCNIVIRFDLYKTLIQYIQSRGRARMPNSRYIHMYEDKNADHLQLIREVYRNEGILKRFCDALPEDRRLSHGKEINLDYLLAKESSHRVYYVPETNAKLNYKMSLQVLGNFVDSLPHSQDTMLNPEYIVTIQNKQFVCEVVLPENSPIRGAIGRPASTKQVAKCSAAFEACLLLRKGKYLDEHLLPIFTKQLPAMRNALLAVDSKKREAYNMRTKPELWSPGGVPGELFLTVMTLERPNSLDRASQPLALLTRSPLPQLPSFVLHFGPGQNSPIQCTSITRSLKVDESIVHKMNTFTLCIFEDVFSKEYDLDIAKMPYFLAPIKPLTFVDVRTDPNDLIAWDILQTIEEYQTRWATHPWESKSWQEEPDEFFNDKYIVDPWDGSRKLWSVGVAHQYKPLDPVPEGSAPRTGTRKNNDNIMEYSCSLWAKARARRSFDESQRVVEARSISLRRNLLDESDASGVESPKKCFIIVEPLKISPLPTTVVAMAYLFPAIIHRIESYLIALDATRLLHLEIPPDLALEAVTKDSDNSDEHNTEKMNFQRGMGNNYERLEFLGDCFLKMSTSISLYSIFPDKDEFSYHVERMMLICNKNLCDNAIKLKLYEFIRSQSFNRRAWYPEGLVLKKGKTAKAPNSHKLGDKTIADVCEAMIGAALLTCKGSGDMDLAVRAVTELVSSENHLATSWSDYYKLYKKPKYQTAVATAAQRYLAEQVESEHAYHFRYPRLLRSAFVHPSYPFSYEHIPSYQRLEFLGDSLLDMACVNFLFHSFPAYDPQWLTEHKMAMTSNQFLGALCVELGFHRHLLLFNSTFLKQIEEYVAEITEAKIQAEDDAVSLGKQKSEYSPDYWISVRQPPKCLPDIIEAYVGAIFVDSEYDYGEVQRFFDEHIKWYFMDMSVYDTFANKQPTTFLTKFLQISMGCMDWSVFPREIPNIEGTKPQIMAVVMVHSQVVSDFTAESSRYAKIGAAKKALELLKGLPLTEFRERFGCNCRVTEDGVEEKDEEHLHGTAV